MATDPRFSRLKGITSKINLVGTDDEIKTQLSLLLGINELLDVTGKGLDLNFERWIDDFENGFRNWTGKTNSKYINGFWGSKSSGRPKIQILKETKEYWTKEGYYLIEFFPNRKNKEDSYLLFGTPLQLIQKLIDFMNQNFVQDDDLLYQILAAIEREAEPFNPKNHPKIKLLFLENSFAFKTKKAKDSTTTRGRAQLSFRLMDKTNEQYTKAEAKALAEKIKNKFVSPVFKFTKGKELYFYKEPRLGKELSCWTKSQTEAQKLFEQTLDLVGDSPDLEKMVKRLNLNPSKAYDDTPGTKIIIGEPTKLDKTRPVVEVEFSSAYLSMDGLRTPICLVDRQFRRKSLVSIN